MKIGDRISVVDDDLRGIVVGFKGNQVTVEDAHGFHYEFAAEKLVPVQEAMYSEKPIAKKDIQNQRKAKGLRTSIDLHINKIHPNPTALSSEERLYQQREHLAKELSRFRSAGIKKIEVIHGLGEGVVQQMVYDYLSSRTGIDFHDKEILREQSGAVMVYLR